MTPKNREELVELMARAIIETHGRDWEEELSDDGRLTYRLEAQAILTALDTAGIDLVPRVATDGMCENMRKDVFSKTGIILGHLMVKGCYSTALSASPFRKEP